MTKQLKLLASERPTRGRSAPRPRSAPAHPWQIDERTREVGRAGLAQARAALREARRAGGERADRADAAA